MTLHAHFSNRPLRWMLYATFGYLALPTFIFLLGWLRLPWAIGGTLLLGVAVWLAVADLLRDEAAARAMAEWWGKLTGRDWLVMLAGSLLLVGISGVGGYGYQLGDWEKHNTIVNDLVRYPWPVYYDYYGQPVGMVYYLAYYLPPALLGKVFGLAAAHHVLALWTLMGFVLSVLWLSLLSKRVLAIAFVFLTLFSGASIVGYLLRHTLELDLFSRVADATTLWSGVRHFFTWSLGWQYTPHVAQLFWVPQHALSGWISAGFIIFVTLVSASRRSLLLVVGVCALWSPLIVIGLAPFLLAGLLPRDQTRLVQRVREHISFANIVGLLVLALMMLFYATKIEPISGVMDAGFRMGTILGELEHWRSPLQMAVGYVLFCLLEFGLFFALDRFHSFRLWPRMKWPYGVMLLWLAGLPFLVFGAYNDLVMRASIPAIFFVCVIVARNGFLMNGAGRVRRGLWLALLLVAAVTPLSEIIYQFNEIRMQGSLYTLKLNPGRDVVNRYMLRPDLLAQYVSSVETPFFQYLARTDGLTPSAEASRSVLFGESIALVDYGLDKRDVAPGESLALLISLQAIAQVDKNYSMSVRLLDEEGGVLWEDQGWPVNSPTSTWAAERRLWHDFHTLTIPAGAQPGIYRLEMYFTDPETWDKLPARVMTTGAGLGEIVPISYVRIGAPQVKPEYPLPSPALFGEEISLLGANLPPTLQVAPGDARSVELIWQAQSIPTTDYSGFVQLLDGDGRVVTQRDQLLTNGFLPSTLWTEGFVVADRYDLQIPADAAPGEYRVITGIYDLATGLRLPVVIGDSPVTDWVEVSRVGVE